MKINVQNLGVMSTGTTDKDNIENEAALYGFHTIDTLRQKLDSLPDGEFLIGIAIGSYVQDGGGEVIG